MASELAGSQISTLMETLPGIAHVLRSPVADAIIGLVRASVRMQEFDMTHAEELVRYATRRSLLGNDEGERVLAEAHAAEQKRLERQAERQQRAQQSSAAAGGRAAKKASKAVKRAKAPPRKKAAKPPKAAKAKAAKPKTSTGKAAKPKAAGKAKTSRAGKRS